MGDPVEMPSLDDAQIAALHARGARVCSACQAEVRSNYCRSCDLFIDSGHTAGCRFSEEEHRDHRTY